MHFRNINSENVNYDNINSSVHNCHTDNNNDILNCDITLNEIERAVKNLKNDKAYGLDNVLNEHIKTSMPIMKHV